MSHRVISVLLALACIVASGVVLQWSEDAPWSAQDIVPVDQGEWLALNDGSEVRIVAVTLGTEAVDENEILGTSGGRFVHVLAEVRAVSEQAGAGRITLHVGDREYRDVMQAFQLTPPGFISTSEAVFEVPSEVVDDLEIRMKDVEIITRYPRVLSHDPELTPEDVEASLNQKVIEPTSELRVIS